MNIIDKVFFKKETKILYWWLLNWQSVIEIELIEIEDKEKLKALKKAFKIISKKLMKGVRIANKDKTISLREFKGDALDKYCERLIFNLATNQCKEEMLNAYKNSSNLKSDKIFKSFEWILDITLAEQEKLGIKDEVYSYEFKRSIFKELKK